MGALLRANASPTRWRVGASGRSGGAGTYVDAGGDTSVYFLPRGEECGDLRGDAPAEAPRGGAGDLPPVGEYDAGGE